MIHTDELDRYRRVMGATTPANPRREIDIQGSLRAFDAAQQPLKRRVLPDWLRLHVRIGATAAVAAAVLALGYLPQSKPQPEITAIAPPDLRLALPADPPAAASRDADVLAAFSTDLPQYFSLPWDRGLVLALLDRPEVQPEEKRLFAAHGRRLVIIPRGPELAGSHGHGEDYQRFAIALAGLALHAAGEDLGPKWTETILLAEARSATMGLPAREAALSAVSTH